MHDRVRHHPPQLIAQLLDWCEANSLAEPTPVSAIGLAYIIGLNEHQIAAATIAASQPIAIRYPDARRAGELRQAKEMEIAADEPAWLAAAIGQLVGQRPVRALLFEPRNRFGRPMTPHHIRAVVAKAALAATGVRMSISTLVGSRTVAVREAGLPLALHGIGYAPRWAARLMGARPVLILPRRAA